MPAPASITYSDSLKTTAQTAVLTDIDAGSGPGKLKLYDTNDALLCAITLTDPSGTITAGVLAISPGQIGSVITGGECTYGAITDSDDNVVVTAPASEGVSTVAGEIVISDLTLISGTDVELISCVIG